MGFPARLWGVRKNRKVQGRKATGGACTISPRR
nr:MAG TPA: hypothetical protein [Caudoviricetes sp.]